MTTPNPPGPPPAGSQPPRAPEPQKHPIAVGQILGGILFVLLIIFIVENSHSVAIRIIAGPEVHPPVWVVIVIAAVIGALISELLRYRRRVGARRKQQLTRDHQPKGR